MLEQGVCLPQHNRRFARPPAQPEVITGASRARGNCVRDLYPLPPGDNAQHQQRLGDPTRRSLAATATAPATLNTDHKSKALVSEYDDGRVEVYYRDEAVSGFGIAGAGAHHGRADAAAGKNRVAEKSQTRPIPGAWVINMRPRFGTPALSAAPVVLRSSTSP